MVFCSEGARCFNNVVQCSFQCSILLSVVQWTVHCVKKFDIRSGLGYITGFFSGICKPNIKEHFFYENAKMQKLKYFFFFSQITWFFSFYFVTNYLDTRPYFKYVLHTNAKEFPDEILKHQRSCKILKGLHYKTLIL